jgi:hypothetical protein
MSDATHSTPHRRTPLGIVRRARRRRRRHARAMLALPPVARRDDWADVMQLVYERLGMAVIA